MFTAEVFPPPEANGSWRMIVARRGVSHVQAVVQISEGGSWLMPGAVCDVMGLGQGEERSLKGILLDWVA